MAMTLLTTGTASNSASLTFNSSIDSTYKLYIFKLIDINPATDQMNFLFQVNVAAASGYNETITSTCFAAVHNESDGDAQLVYVTTRDQAQGTAFQPIAPDIGNGADESAAGTLWLFNPSNTTYVKHWYSRVHAYNQGGDYAQDFFAAGYFNVTGAIDDVQFKSESGNFDGTIKMYGVG